jgi:hypothetical protein
MANNPNNAKTVRIPELDQHLVHQMREKQIPLNAVLRVVGSLARLERLDNAPGREQKGKCPRCKKYKTLMTTKDPLVFGNEGLSHDLEVVVCKHCNWAITAYINPKTQGNTVLRADQIAQGKTSYIGSACTTCGFRPVITARTQQELSEQEAHNCETFRRTGKR